MLCLTRLPASKSAVPYSTLTATRLFHHTVQVAQQRALRLPSSHPSLLPVVLSASNLFITPIPPARDTHIGGFNVASRTRSGDLVNHERVVPFYSSSRLTDRRPVGYLRPEVAEIMLSVHSEAGEASPWNVMNGTDAYGDKTSAFGFSKEVESQGKGARTMHMEKLVKEWKKLGLFKEILKGSSNEAFPVFHHGPTAPFFIEKSDPLAFSIERAALPLFGFPNFGSLLIAYFRDKAGQTMLWIPRRSITKKTWPGALDVTVGGGIGIGQSARDTIVRECVEEASLPTHFVQAHARSVGLLPFPNRKPSGWLLPGYYYLFEMELPSDGSIKPCVNPADGEVDNFELMDMETVLRNLLEGVFKPSSALAVVELFIRHGFITEDSDPNFTQVCRALRRDVM